ncbi:MAG: hypothetical protein ACJ71D_08245 [Nitrososphaera sp.]
MPDIEHEHFIRKPVEREYFINKIIQRLTKISTHPFEILVMCVEKNPENFRPDRSYRE